MKLQTLTIIFIIIMLPITMLVSQYIKTEISTINNQTQYDTRLNNATYDAIKSFQLNESNSTTSDVTSEKMRDVNASIKSFYNSLASGMGTSGYTEEDLKYYIPCLVYCLYDGYYIYTAYDNNGTKEYGLKPYVYYTEHITGNGGRTDLILSYTLDSYVSIIGKLNGRTIAEAGYLYNKDNLPEIFEGEGLDENVMFRGEINFGVSYKYENFRNLAGVPSITGQSRKYYNLMGHWYSYGTDGNLKEETQQVLLDKLNESDIDNSARNYFRQNRKIVDDIVKLKDCTNENGELCSYLNIGKNNDPDVYSSAFNEHRRKVIKKSIRSNLVASITNFKRKF